MYTGTSISDSLITDLCREVDYIKVRSQCIINSLANCQSKKLIVRLKNELEQLKSRRNYIKGLSKTLSNHHNIDSLSIDLLNELIGRSLIQI